jgi:uncharacterized protein (TIGR02391 family)
MINEQRNDLLIKFLKLIASEDHFRAVDKIFKEAGLNISLDKSITDFYNRNSHPIIFEYSKNLYMQENYFHAVFEAVKVYNKLVKEKARSKKDGQPLMLDVWRADGGVLKVTACKTETEKDFQNGIQFLSAGLMSAVRNPTAHEPHLLWPISKEDCLDLLSFISYLLRQLDKAVYYKE